MKPRLRHKRVLLVVGSLVLLPVLALGWQVNPGVAAHRMKELLFESAHVCPGDEKIINPAAFLAAVKLEPTQDSGAKAP